MPASGAGQHYAGMGSNPIVCIFLINKEVSYVIFMASGLGVGDEWIKGSMNDLFKQSQIIEVRVDAY